ncbi:MAG: DUF92 domain-containing protein [Candidatus Zixiibacteriota bacterium]
MTTESLIAVLPDIAIGLVLAALLAIVSFKFRALTISGAVGMTLIGAIVFGIGGVVFAIPLILFFITSSLLSTLKSNHKENALREADKTSPRDIYQVLANGGIASIIVIIYFITDNSLWYLVYLAAVVEATADTWATEIGMLSRHKPVSITTFKETTPGRSGGITLLGTASSLFGPILIAGSGLICVQFSKSTPFLFDWPLWGWTALAGWIGALIDSVLGATIQAQYQCPACGKITEKKFHCGKEATLQKGLSYINNDIVNFISTVMASLLMLVIIRLFFIYGLQK